MNVLIWFDWVWVMVTGCAAYLLGSLAMGWVMRMVKRAVGVGY